MVFYLIPLFFIDIFLLFAAFKGFIISSVQGSFVYRFVGALSVALYAFLSCEVILDILEYYYSIQMFEQLSATPLYAVVVAVLTMMCAYKNGNEWVQGYLVNLEGQD